MKNDSKSCFPAEVDVSNARFSKGLDLGFDLINEIDVWTQMEFRARYQMKHLRQYGVLNKQEHVKATESLVYGIRQSLPV
jgi:hypothetical protein